MPRPPISSILDLLPGLDPVITSYLSSFLSDIIALETDDPVETFVRPLLQSERVSTEDTDRVCEELRGYVDDVLAANDKSKAPEKRVLDKSVSLRGDGGPVLVAGGATVDISSIVKGRTSQVDVKKLEKAEAKIRAKMERRTAGQKRMVEFESSKLVEAMKAQQAYEDMFVKVNPLTTAAARAKSKDIHLENIDVSFGSNPILSNATLTLAYGRRYGLIGRNGVGKSTLLKNMALRELSIPLHITILYVEQEVLPSTTTSALDSVLQADVWRTRLMAEEKELTELLESTEVEAKRKEEATTRLGEVHKLLEEIEADKGPYRAAELLAGLGFSQEDQQRPTGSFSGGWRMRLSIARALFCKPDLLLLDEPSNNLDLNALAWLEDYLKNQWQSTLLVVSHDRTFLDEVATDIVWQHDKRLDYFKGNFTQFYATKTERTKNQKREYEAQQQYRAHLQAFIDRWRYNANRAPQAQSRIKILEKLPELEPPEDDDVVKFKFAEADKISPPVLQLQDATFSYSDDMSKAILRDVNISVSQDSRIGVIGPNGGGKSTLIKLLVGENQPQSGQVNRNGRLRIGYFAQHHIDQLDLDLNPVAFLAKKFPGKTEQEYRSHLGGFGITGTTGLQKLQTLSGGQKSRVTFAALSLARPHVLLLDEPTNHLDIEGLDALMAALNNWNGGVILISHDSRFIETVCKELWVCAGNGACELFKGDVNAYKSLIVANQKNKPT
ncbi:P-loop containing nucleoside triphosphate hydrolase protein [Atractiella rhizophila]|nr:P-loop containing nucleoside triphosphate hydrolase protein [Atractiella rhizophila]